MTPRLIARTLWHHRTFLAGLLAVDVAAGAIGSALPLASKVAVDAVESGGSTRSLAFAGLILAGSAVLRFGTGGLRSWVASRSQGALLADLMERLHRRVLAGETLESERSGSVYLASRSIQDCQVLVSALIATIHVFVRGPIEILGLAAVLIYMDPWLGLVGVGGTAVVALFSRRSASGVGRTMAAAARAKAEVLARVREDLARRAVIRVYRAAEVRLAALRRAIQELVGETVRAGLVRWRAGAAGEALVAAVAVAAVFTIALRSRAGALTAAELTGALVAAVGLAASGAGWNRSLIDFRGSLRAASQTARRIEAAPGPAPAADGGRRFDRLEVFDLHVSREGRPVLCGVGLTVRAGRPTVLSGPNGSGKSTLALALLGLLAPEQGRIVADGVELGLEELRAHWGRIGWLPQDCDLFSGSIEENLALAGAPVAAEERERLLEALGVAALLRAGGHRLVEGVEGLSGGERRRVALARALLAPDGFTLLDEPLAEIDPASQPAIWREIARRATGNPVLVVSHQPPPADLECAALALEAGRVVSPTRPAGPA